jgi:hypothetical protein
MALDIARNVGLADLAEVDGAARAHLAQEGADERQMVDDGLRRQTSFLPQIVAERIEDLLMRCERSQHRRCDRARLAKHR